MQTHSKGKSLLLILAPVILMIVVGLGVWVGGQGATPTQAQPVTAAKRPPSVERDQLAPLFSLSTPRGEMMDLAAFEGQVVLINFWATWCPPCRDEMPVIEAAHQKYGSQGFRVLAVNVQETPTQVEAFRQQLGLSFPMVLDSQGHVTRVYRVQNLPRSFFLGRDGRVARIHPGELTTETVELYLKELL